MGKTLYRSHDDSRRNAAWRISHINLAGRRLVLGGFPQRDFQLQDGLPRIVRSHKLTVFPRSAD